MQTIAVTLNEMNLSNSTQVYVNHASCMLSCNETWNEYGNYSEYEMNRAWYEEMFRANLVYDC